MPDAAPADKPVENPTYMADIRHFFEQVDIDHMAAKGIDLSQRRRVAGGRPKMECFDELAANHTPGLAFRW